MLKLLKYLITNIVDEPQKIKIKKEKNEEGIIFLIDVAESDRGKIIGKDGKIITSLRNIVNVKAKKENEKVFLKLDF